MGALVSCALGRFGLRVLHDPQLLRLIQRINDLDPCFYIGIENEVSGGQLGRLCCFFAQEFAVIVSALSVWTNKDVLAVFNSPASANIPFPVCILAFLGERVVIRFLECLGSGRSLPEPLLTSRRLEDRNHKHHAHVRSVLPMPGTAVLLRPITECCTGRNNH